MSITMIRVKAQDKSLNPSRKFVYRYKITPDCDNPLDLCRIFSRHHFSNDFNGYKRKKAQALVTKQASVAYHDAKIVSDRVLRDRIRLHIHKDMIKVTCESALTGLSRGGGIRGKVAGFSKASRKRMIDLMCQQRHGAPKTFVSLTYADEALIESNEHGEVLSYLTPEDWHNHVEILRKRIERRFPELRALWRLELKKRKSGQYQGMIAPHYHLIIWGHSPEDTINVSTDDTSIEETTFAKWLNEQWYDILGTGLSKAFKHGTHISEVKSTRHAMFYVSKYVAKLEDDFHDDYEVGRRWGRIGTFETYASIMNLMSKDEFTQFRRLIRSWLKSRGSDYRKRLRGASLEKGFSVYGLGDLLRIDGSIGGSPLALKMLSHAVVLASNNWRSS